jgi:REP element-mobilizing transposase RayT
MPGMSRRRQRVDVEGGIHHVMNRGVNRQLVFFSDLDRIEFGRVLAEIHERFGVETLAYCLMHNHYHLLLRCPDGGLSEAMQHLGSAYTRRTNDRVGRDGPLFRGRFHAIHVADDTYLKWVVRYIHRNALDLPGVQACEDYRWSSYRTYIGLRATPPFVNRDFLIEMFDWNRDRLEEFTHAEVAAPIESIESIIELAIAVDQLAHGDDDDGYGRQQIERTVRLLLLDTLIGRDIRAVLARGLPTGAAFRKALSRARQRRASDESIRRIVSSAAGLLGHAAHAA